MNFNVIPTSRFKKEAKKLIKRYISLKEELFDLEKILTANPQTGTELGNNAYKIRLGIKSKGKGKSGGARVITYVITENFKVYLLSIYDKSDLDSIDEKNLKALIKEIKKN